MQNSHLTLYIISYKINAAQKGVRQSQVENEGKPIIELGVVLHIDFLPLAWPRGSRVANISHVKESGVYIQNPKRYRGIQFVIQIEDYTYFVSY